MKNGKVEVEKKEKKWEYLREIARTRRRGSAKAKEVERDIKGTMQPRTSNNNIGGIVYSITEKETKA